MEDEIKEMIPTHKVSLYGVRCYFDVETNEICGTNWLFDLLIVPVCHVHNAMDWLCEATLPGYIGRQGFPLTFLEEYIYVEDDNEETGSL